MSVHWGPNLHYVAPKAKYALPDCDFKIQINSAGFVPLSLQTDRGQVVR